MSDTITEPHAANLFLLDAREPRWVAWLALAATLLLHVGVVLVLPSEMMSIREMTAEEEAVQTYEISLVEPSEARFVEANPEAPENEPDRTDQYSYRSQQAADESPLKDELNQPNVDGEEDSQKILQGSLQQAPPIEPGVYQPAARPGEGEGEQGGKLGNPSEVAIPTPVQPRPAPAFIQQDPVTEEGPGSRSDLTGEALEVFENPDPEAPIEIYRPQPQPMAEEFKQPGDGAGGAEEAQPRPRVRPRLAPELITGPLMRSKGSASRRGSIAIDATFSEFGEYEQQFYAAIQTGWYQEIEFFQPIDTATRVRVQFTIYADGKVADVKAVQTTASEIATFICETAIAKRSPFRPWTKEMVLVFGQQRTLTVMFHYR